MVLKTSITNAFNDFRVCIATMQLLFWLSSIVSVCFNVKAFFLFYLFNQNLYVETRVFFVRSHCNARGIIFLYLAIQ